MLWGFVGDGRPCKFMGVAVQITPYIVFSSWAVLDATLGVNHLSWSPAVINTPKKEPKNFEINKGD